MSRTGGRNRSNFARGALLGLIWGICGLLSACSSEMPGGSTALVVPGQLRLRSSTAEAARTVGELRGGEVVTIKERSEADGIAWARVIGPNGVSGWTQVRNLISEDLAARSQKLAEEMQAIPGQAIGRSKASLKLRLAPDRTTEDNVLTLMPSGTEVEILARDRRPRPATASGETESATDTKYDEWYQVRLRDNKVTPAGWIYGGSVELQVPHEISYYGSFGRRIVGWQKLPSAQGAEDPNAAFVVLERQISGAGEGIDFDRLKVMAYDAVARDYYTPYREDLDGRFPASVEAESGRGTFAVRQVKDGATNEVKYGFETLEGGKLKVTRLTPKEPVVKGRRK